jgi:hypothetical protein
MKLILVHPYQLMILAKMITMCQKSFQTNTIGGHDAFPKKSPKQNFDFLLLLLLLLLLVTS